MTLQDLITKGIPLNAPLYMWVKSKREDALDFEEDLCKVTLELEYGVYDGVMGDILIVKEEDE